ncbi:MAG: response regulator [Chloroflexota bacterium]
MAHFVLIIEDDEAMGRVMQITLERAGIQTAYAPNGFAALNMLEERKPDAVLLDIAMPGMNGWESLQAMNEQHPDKQFPVIILSAFDDQTNKTIGQLQSRVFRYIVKPFDPSFLLKTVYEALGVTD